MFAYCGNNPVNYFDKTGRAPDSLAGWAGEAIGEWLYELFTGRTHPNKQAREIETQIIQKQNKIVADTGKAIWDGYMRGYDIHQESQTIESQMILDGATKIYKYYDEKEKLQQGVSAGKKIITGARNIYSGAVAILAPAPTPIEDVIGVNKITWGIIKVCYGIVEAISTLVG